MTLDVDKIRSYQSITFRQSITIRVKEGSAPGLLIVVGTVVDGHTEDPSAAQKAIRELVDKLLNYDKHQTG